MATTGKIPTLGFGAGFLGAVVLLGWSSSPVEATVTTGRIPTIGFTAGEIGFVTLLGFSSGSVVFTSDMIISSFDSQQPVRTVTFDEAGDL